MERKQSVVVFHLYFVSFFLLIFILSLFCHLLIGKNLISILAQFGPCSFGPQHGFARITRWTLERSPERLHNGDVEAVFSLMDNDFTRSMWNYP